MAKKFNVGDKVRIVSEHQPHWDYLGKMDKWAGKIVTVKEHPFIVSNGVKFEECPQWAWCESDIEEVVEAASAQTPKFKVGQKVRIKGDASDCTDHLDGKVGVITEVDEKDCRVEGDDHHLWHWNYNLTVVEDTEEVKEDKETEKAKKLSPADAPAEFDKKLAQIISDFARSVIKVSDEFNVDRKKAMVIAAKAIDHSAHDDFFWDIIVPMDELMEKMDE